MRQQSADTRLRQPVVQLFVPAKRAEQTNEKKERAMDTFALDLNRHPYSLGVTETKSGCSRKLGWPFLLCVPRAEACRRGDRPRRRARVAPAYTLACWDGCLMGAVGSVGP